MIDWDSGLFITWISTPGKYDITRIVIDNPIVFEACGKQENNFLEIRNETEIKRIALDNDGCCQNSRGKVFVRLEKQKQ